MAIDILLIVHMPFSVEAEIPATLYRQATMPAIPRMGEWVWFLDEDYLPVNRIRFREDTRVELHFDDVSYLIHGDFTPESVSDLNDALQLAGYSGTDPWAAEI